MAQLLCVSWVHGFIRIGEALILFPLASAGATEGHREQSFDEQGMSCLR